MVQFKRGFLYPELRDPHIFGERRRWAAILLRQFSKAEKENTHSNRAYWSVYDTPLTKYAKMFAFNSPNANFQTHLEGLIKHAKQEGTKVRILDVGIGSGKQWIEFLSRNGEYLELHGTSLTHSDVLPSLKKQVKLVSSASLHKKYKPGYFDVIVSNYGIHYQEKEALENIIHLLKPGGEAILSGEREPPPLVAGNPHYAVLSNQSEQSGKYHFPHLEWCMWLRKRE